MSGAGRGDGARLGPYNGPVGPIGAEVLGPKWLVQDAANPALRLLRARPDMGRHDKANKAKAILRTYSHTHPSHNNL